MTYEYQLSPQQLTQQMVGEYLIFFQNYTRRNLIIAQSQTLFFDQFNQPNFSDLAVILAITVLQALHARLVSCKDARLGY